MEQKTKEPINKTKLILTVIWIGLVLIAVFFVGKYFKNTYVTQNDIVTISDKYLTDLNKRLSESGNPERIEKIDVQFSDSMVKSGLTNVSSQEVWLNPQTKEDGGMVGFSPREQNMFKPNIRALRKALKEDPEYCSVMLSKEECDWYFNSKTEK